MKIKVVKDPQEGVDYLKNLLYSVVDDKTVLFLSGGKTPKDLYLQLAIEEKINPGAVAMVDERIGVKNHEASNERMIKGTGLLSYFEEKKIPFYPILPLRDYDRIVKSLLEHFSKGVTVLGIGEDGHIASIPAGNQKSKIKNQKYVERVDDFPIEPKERITLTFKALAEMDLLIVLVLGSAKQNALRRMFDPSAGSGQAALGEIPARFFLKKDIASKVILITDQKV